MILKNGHITIRGVAVDQGLRLGSVAPRPLSHAEPDLPTQSPAAELTVQNVKVFRWWDYPIFAALTAVTWIGIFYFFRYWFSLDNWRNYTVSFWGLTFVAAGFFAINQFRWCL